MQRYMLFLVTLATGSLTFLQSYSSRSFAVGMLSQYPDTELLHYVVIDRNTGKTEIN